MGFEYEKDDSNCFVARFELNPVTFLMAEALASNIDESVIVDLARSLHPDITDYVTLVHQPDIIPFWWALALGAGLGGNGTIIGAGANVVIVDIARKSGYRITFWQFFKS